MDNKKTKYVEYIKRHLPNVEINEIDFNFADGLCNDIVIANKEIVFRFAKYDWGKELLKNEVSVINVVKKHVDMRVMQLELIEDGIAKCDFIKGGPVFRNHVLKQESYTQDKIAEQIGIFLRQLHSIPLDVIQKNNIRNFPADFSREGTYKSYEEIKEKLFPYLRSYTRENIEQIFNDIFEDKAFFEYDPVLLHGELDLYHFRFDAEKNVINGVIDFGGAGIGNPSHDISVLLTYFGERFLKRIDRYYHGMERYIKNARYYSFMVSVHRALRGIQSNDVFWHLVNIDEARDILPINSPW